ncbi:MAG: T9SS type A sorting domain-containing protein [Dysgonomonas sp.]
MKKIRLFLFVILTLSLEHSQLLYSQVTDDVFPRSGAMWRVSSYASSHGYGRIDYYTYGLSGDTVINEKTYNKLYLLNDSVLSIDENDLYVAGIRQIDRKVFMQPATDNSGKTLSEFLLYDFSKTVGDSASFDRPYEGYGDCRYPTFYDYDYSDLNHYKNLVTADKITSYGRQIEIGNYNYGYGAYGDEAWVEGVGSLSGFFFPVISLTTCCGGSGGRLMCMKQGDNVKYMLEGCPSCMGGESGDFDAIETQVQSSTTLVYDKTTRSILVSGATQSLRLRLTTLEGKLAASWQLDGSSTSVNVSSLAAGIYIYRLSSNNLNQTGKLILN